MKFIALVARITWGSDKKTVNVMFNIHLLNAKFPKGTEFILKSTCPRNLTRGLRTISPVNIFIRGTYPRMKLGSEHEITTLSP